MELRWKWYPRSVRHRHCQLRLIGDALRKHQPPIRPSQIAYGRRFSPLARRQVCLSERELMRHGFLTEIYRQASTNSTLVSAFPSKRLSWREDDARLKVAALARRLGKSDAAQVPRADIAPRIAAPNVSTGREDEFGVQLSPWPLPVDRGPQRPAELRE